MSLSSRMRRPTRRRVSATAVTGQMNGRRKRGFAVLTSMHRALGAGCVQRTTKKDERHSELAAHCCFPQPAHAPASKTASVSRDASQLVRHAPRIRQKGKRTRKQVERTEQRKTECARERNARILVFRKLLSNGRNKIERLIECSHANRPRRRNWPLNRHTKWAFQLEVDSQARWTPVNRINDATGDRRRGQRQTNGIVVM